MRSAPAASDDVVARFDWSARARRAFRLVGARASIRAFYTARTRCGERDVRIYATRVNPRKRARACPFRVCVTVSHLNAPPRDRARAVTRRTRARDRARATRATRRIDGDAFTSTTATREIGARTRRTRGATVLTRAGDGATARAIMEATTTTTTTGANARDEARRSLEALGEREFLDDLVRGDARRRERGRNGGY